MAQVEWGDVLEHYRDEMASLGYTFLTTEFDVTKAPDSLIDRAFVIIPGKAVRGPSLIMVDEELQLEVAFRQPPRGLESAKAISAARLRIVWHFLQKENYGPASAVIWAGSEVVDLDGEIMILRIDFVISYEGLLVPKNA